jgi:hypothetical protein
MTPAQRTAARVALDHARAALEALWRGGTLPSFAWLPVSDQLRFQHAMIGVVGAVGAGSVPEIRVSGPPAKEEQPAESNSSSSPGKKGSPGPGGGGVAPPLLTLLLQKQKQQSSPQLSQPVGDVSMEDAAGGETPASGPPPSRAESVAPQEAGEPTQGGDVDRLKSAEKGDAEMEGTTDKGEVGDEDVVDGDDIFGDDDFDDGGDKGEHSLAAADVLPSQGEASGFGEL